MIIQKYSLSSILTHEQSWQENQNAFEEDASQPMVGSSSKVKDIFDTYIAPEKRGKLSFLLSNDPNVIALNEREEEISSDNKIKLKLLRPKRDNKRSQKRLKINPIQFNSIEYSQDPIERSERKAAVKTQGVAQRALKKEREKKGKKRQLEKLPLLRV